jgi:hypothetical protein
VDEVVEALDAGGHGEAQGMALTRGDALGGSDGIESAAGAAVDRSLIAVRGRGGGLDLGARAEARVDEPGGAQLLERGGVAIEALRLADQLAIPCQAEPGEILELAKLELLLAAVDI